MIFALTQEGQNKLLITSFCTFRKKPLHWIEAKSSNFKDQTKIEITQDNNSLYIVLMYTQEDNNPYALEDL